jgi:DNA polymerase/3'-5' exonuclease PolX
MLQRTDENQRIAELLREAAELLKAQGANPFRVNAYRKAADTAAALDRPVRTLFEERGRPALEALPGIGRGIASSIAEILITDRWSQLQRLRGDGEPERVFRSVPGIGPELAHRIHNDLHLDNLEALELACKDGRLERVTGIGGRRAMAISAALTAILDQRRAFRRPLSAATCCVGTAN